LNTIINFIRIIQALLIVLSSQAIIVSMVMIGVIIYINILQRSREIGVMKTVGYLNRDVKSIFVYESLIITSLSLIIAFVVAAILGIVANLVVKHFSTTIDSIYSLSLVSIVAITLFSFLMGYLSAYLPTRKISKMDPVESLRWE
jgi:ABC-type antimicrobial peptide transport system permease subunit